LAGFLIKSERKRKEIEREKEWGAGVLGVSRTIVMTIVVSRVGLVRMFFVKEGESDDY